MNSPLVDRTKAAFFGLVFLIVMSSPALPASPEWSQLPPIPDEQGFAGCFAGISNGALIVAGGANVTARKWQPDFVKTWYDSVFVLERPDGKWIEGGKLPAARGYGVSITVPEGLMCIGGSNASGHTNEVWLVSWMDGALTTRKLSPLPKTCANLSGAMVGNRIYVAGGIERPDATTALKETWVLDYANPKAAWQALEPCPGPARMLAVAAADGDAFYYLSGASLNAGADGKAVRTFLRDAWRYVEGQGWDRLPDLPRSATAAPSPAPVIGGKILVPTGDDGLNVTFEPLEKHPGFPRDTLIYEVATKSWSTVPGLPFSRATVPVTEWMGRFVIPNGEVRPRVRTNEVWILAK